MPDFRQRYLTPEIAEALKEKMVFIGGPRQVGKTTLSLSILGETAARNPHYLNWDNLKDRAQIKKFEIPQGQLIVFDELHKYKIWRSFIKGLYDSNKGFQNYLLTGSARLDHYRRGGDSLLGRYRYFRLHPFSVSELALSSNADVQALLKFGGFPEPFFSQSEKKVKIWRNERLYRIVYDDISNLERLREFSSIELLADALPDRVGSPLSLKSLGEDLEVSQKTVDHWVSILEKVYFCYRIPPFGSPKIRAVKKENKLFLWDWSAIDNPGNRFENMVASHLLKYCHFMEDTEGDRMELRFIRDTDRREIDFVVLKNKKPLFAVECKTGEAQISRHIHYFRERTPIPMFYQVHLGAKDYRHEGNIRVLPFYKFCQELGLK